MSGNETDFKNRFIDDQLGFDFFLIRISSRLASLRQFWSAFEPTEFFLPDEDLLSG